MTGAAPAAAKHLLDEAFRRAQLRPLRIIDASSGTSRRRLQPGVVSADEVQANNRVRRALFISSLPPPLP